MVRGCFLVALLTGAALRLAALPLPGTHDIAVWKIWSYVAAHEGIGRMYGTGGNPPEHRVVSFHGAETTVDYPPLALTELELAGAAYRGAMRGDYPDDARLIVALKIPILLADCLLGLLMYYVVKRLAGGAAAQWATLAYWLNPAVLLDGVALGYLDLLFVLPAVGALSAAALEWPAFAGCLGMAALLTKPQAIVLAPAVALAIVNGPGRAPTGRRVVAAAVSAVVMMAASLVPVVRAGGLPNLINAMERLGHHDMLSGNACNLWWIDGYLLRAVYSSHDMGLWPALVAPARILAISRVVELGYPNPRLIGGAMAGAFGLWVLWTGRRARDLWLVSAVAALLVHGYSNLAAQVHENHLFAAVPLLVIAAAGRPAFRPLALAVTAIVALNLNLFYGISEDIGYGIPRALTIIDMTVPLSLINCGALVWHAVVFNRECSREAVPRRQPAPA